MLYYPECDGHLFYKEMPTEEFDSDADAVSHYKIKFAGLLMAVIKDDDPDISVVYSR